MHHTDTDRQLALRGCRRIHQMHERQGDPLHATSRIANLVCRSSIPRARFLTDSFSIFISAFDFRGAWPIRGAPAPRFLRRFAACRAAKRAVSLSILRPEFAFLVASWLLPRPACTA